MLIPWDEVSVLCITFIECFSHSADRDRRETLSQSIERVMEDNEGKKPRGEGFGRGRLSIQSLTLEVFFSKIPATNAATAANNHWMRKAWTASHSSTVRSL